MFRISFFVQSVNCPSLLTDSNETYTNCAACFGSDIFKVLGRCLNRKRDALKKVLCTIRKVPFFFDRSSRNLKHLCHILRKWYVNIFGQMLWMEGEIFRRKYFVQSVKCRSLLTDLNETYTTCVECSKSNMFTVSERWHKYKARCFEEGSLYN